MKLLFWIFSLISILMLPETSTEGTLYITVENVKKSKGKIMLAVYAEEENFLSEIIYRGVHQEVTQSGEVKVEIADLPYGTYAISLYHDVNGNEELDTNFIKIPKEPYGFSNNARGMFGPPKYKKKAFVKLAAGQKISIFEGA